MQILTFIYIQNTKRNITEHMSCRICIQRSLTLAEIICSNFLPLCNRETLVHDLRNILGIFVQIIQARITSKKAECVEHTDCMGQFTLSRVLVILAVRLQSHPCPFQKCQFVCTNIRGCLHDTGTSFILVRVHPGSYLSLCICLHDTCEKSHTSTTRTGMRFYM